MTGDEHSRRVGGETGVAEAMLRESDRKAREVFGKRAAYYTTSTAHTDKAVLDRVVELARPNRNATALDVATGTGHTAFALAPHVSRVTAVDITPEMLEEARRLQPTNGLANVDFLPLGQCGRSPVRRCIVRYSDLPPCGASFREYRAGISRDAACPEARRPVGYRRPQRPGGRFR